MADKKIKIITHSGHFHIDELLAVATLDLLLGGNYTLIRTRDPEVVETGDYVVDVGGKYIPEDNKFDHHQEGGAGARENGIQYSSFGLVWKKFGAEVCGSTEVADIIDKKIATYVDAQDNGVDTYRAIDSIDIYTLPKAIKIFRPLFEEDLDMDEGFGEAFKFVKRILEREILKGKKYIATKGVVEEAYLKATDKRIIILEKYVPAVDLIGSYPETLFFLAPRIENGTWTVHAVAKDRNTFSARKAFPEQWSGKIDESLVEVTGVDDAKFCHRSGEFICIAGSREGALKLAKLAVEA